MATTFDLDVARAQRFDEQRAHWAETQNRAHRYRDIPTLGLAQAILRALGSAQRYGLDTEIERWSDLRPTYTSRSILDVLRYVRDGQGDTSS